MPKRHGIYVASRNLFYHSTVQAGINHTPVLQSIDIGFLSDSFIETSGNSSANNEIGMGIGGGSAIRRTLAYIDFSSLPAGIVFVSAELRLTVAQDLSSNARTMRVYRVLRNVVMAECTSVIYSTGNNWGTTLCGNSTTDYDGSIELGSGTQPASPAVDSVVSYTLVASEIQKLFDGVNVGSPILLKVDTEVSDLITYWSANNSTKKPVIRLGYYN